ncbi:MAG: translocation/assembly module TamB domain-containing protein, partial [Bacteroidota bacterium]
IQTENLNFNALGLRDFLDARKLTLNVELDGRGSSQQTAQLALNGYLVRSEIMGRPIDSLFADISVENDALIGKVFGKDEEGQFNLDLTIDQSVPVPIYQAKGKVSGFNLKRYGLNNKDISLSTEINGDLQGRFPDDVTGQLKLADTKIRENTNEKDLMVPEFWFRADRIPDDSKYYNLKSSLLDADITGHLNLSQGFKLINALAEETKLFLENNDSLTQAYYAQKVIDTSQVHGKFALAPKQGLNEVFDLFDLPLRLGHHGLMTGEFDFGQTENINMVMGLDSIRYGSFSLMGSQIDLELFKLAENAKLAVVGAMLVDSVLLPKNGKLEKINFSIDGFEQNYESTFIAVQEEYNNRIQLQLKTLFAKDGSIRSAVNPSNSLLVMRGDTLPVSQEDSIIYSLEDKRLDIINLMLANNNTYIRAEGQISPDAEDLFSLDLSQFDLNLFRDLYPATYFPNGKLNANVSMRNLLKDPDIKSKIRVDSLGIDDFDYGNVFGNLSWKESENIVRLESQLYENQRDTTLALSGSYALNKEEEPLYMELETLKALPLEYAYPFVKKQLYGIKGSVELDKFIIKGNLDDFKVNGVGHFTDAGFGLDYFKTEYSFDGSIKFNNNRIDFPRVQLYDKNRNHADFYGYIYHEGLQTFDFDLQLDEVSNFLVMDTKKEDNELFYGKVLVKAGVANITGNLDKLLVSAEVLVGDSSYLKVPVSYETEFGRPDYIRFKGDVDTETPVNTGLKGLEIKLATRVTEEAQVELIFDERVGDIIQGRGSGTINMAVNTDGEFSMYGDYEISEGNYLFTAQNVFNKKFQVKQGGNITWSGDPYDARLNLEAIYPLYADIREIINEENAVRVPVHVLMNMQGSLMEPDIQLSIALPSMSSGDIPQIASYLNTITYDEQELNKQVFSLMVFNRFAPTGGFITGQDAASLGVTTSVSEMLSNQLSYWLSRAVDDNLSVNLGTSNFKDVNLLVSYKLFNDRVIIERDGNLVSSDSNLTIGNLSVIIKLLPSGRSGNVRGASRRNELVLEVFNREGIDSELYNNTSQTGLGIFYKKDFDKLGNIFKRKKKE